ncbi:brother of Yb [Oratosquilla oratoria]|uniref:brother of Yb n=1 Tax=Oratosquilla oratoria TaxID=337810 RepID=UPI003F75C93D
MAKMERTGKLWTNLVICKVEDPQTVWLKEIPSPSMSASLRNFQEMEVQMNEYYNFRKRKRMQRVPITGEVVAVCRRDRWYRAQVEKVLNTSWSFQVGVFLLDHGKSVSVQIENVAEMKPGEWTSVEYQAFKVQLFGVCPISLKYSKEMKVVYRKVGSWDPSAYDYATKLFDKYWQADFLPLKCKDVAVGFLFIHIEASPSPEKDLIPESVFDAPPCSPLQEILLEESAFFENVVTEDPRRINALHVLVALGYATIDTEAFLQYEQEVKDGKALSVTEFSFPFHKREQSTQEKKEIIISPKQENYSEVTFMEVETAAPQKASQMPQSTLEYPPLDISDGSSSCEELSEGNMRQSNPAFSANGRVPSGGISSLQKDVSNIEISSREKSPCIGQRSSLLSSSGMLDVKNEWNENKSHTLSNYDSEVSEDVSSNASYNISSGCQSSGNVRSTPKLCNTSIQKNKSVEHITPEVRQENRNYWGEIAIPVPMVKGQQQVSCELSDPLNQVAGAVECSPFMKLTSSFKQPPNFVAAEQHNWSFRAMKKMIFSKPDQKEKKESISSSVGAAVETEDCSNSQMLDEDKINNIGRPITNTVPFLSPKSTKERKTTQFSHGKPHEQIVKKIQEKRNGNLSPEVRIQNFVVPSEGIVLKGIGSCFPNQNKSLDLFLKKDKVSKERPSSVSSKLNVLESKKQNSKYSFPMMTCKWDRKESSNVKEEEKSVVGTKTYNCTNIKKEYELPFLARLNRVFVAGEGAIGEEEVVTNLDMSKAVLNSHVSRVVSRAELYVSRIQSYMWSALTKGISAVVVGGKRSGKTFGYLVPLISCLSDMAPLIAKRLPPGIGPMMIIVCGSWRQVKDTGNHISVLLPPTRSLKCVTAWGGQGQEEEERVKKQMLSGCDILVSTLPFLMKVLNKNKNNETEGLCTTLNRCCYLIIDDAETVIENEPGNTKSLLELFGQGRAKRKRLDDVQQIVVVGSQWTKLLDDLTCTLAPLSPTVLISSHQEAAIAARVPTQVHYIQNEEMIFSKILCLVHEEDGHILIFVKNEEIAAQLQDVLENAAVHTVNIDAVPSTWELKRQINMWRTSASCSMLIPESAVPYLLLQDLRDASTIIHQFIPEKSKGLFGARYSFMMDRFCTVIGQKSVNCKSHVLLTKEIITMNAAVVKELKRMKAYIPQDVEKISVGITRDERKSMLPLCYFQKSYGICTEQQCKWRHEILPGDQPLHLPEEGDVEFELVEVINASCYLVRLVNYRASAGQAFTSLKSFYLNLFLAMQQFFSVKENQKVVTSPAVGLVCAVWHGDVWTRAKILHINYAADVMKVHLFFMDDGLELSKNVHEIFQLPEYLAAMPQLIVEVHLCCVRPLDNDREWTRNASEYIRKLFTSSKAGPARKFVGKVALAVGHTLWLSPVVEMVQKGNTYLKLKAFRNQLLTEGYGQKNDSHLERLESACEQAGWKVRQDDSGTDYWLELYREVDEKIRYEMGSVSCKEIEDTEDVQTDLAYNTKTDEVIDGLVNTEKMSLKNESITKIGDEISVTTFNIENEDERAITSEWNRGEMFHAIDNNGIPGEDISITDDFNRGIGKETCIRNISDTETGVETSGLNEFSNEISKASSSTNEYDVEFGEDSMCDKFNAEVAKKTSGINVLGAEIGEETSSTDEVDAGMNKQTSVANEFTNEVDRETAYTNQCDIDLSSGLSSTDEFGTEIDEVVSKTRFNIGVDEETSSSNELNKELNMENSTFNELNKECVESSVTDELNTETGVHDDDKSPCINEVDSQNPAEKLGSECVDEEQPEVVLGARGASAGDKSCLKYEFLTVNEKLTVEVTEIISPECFFVIKEEMFAKLDSLEDYIQELTEDWGRRCSDSTDEVVEQPSRNVPLGSVCLAPFDDDEFYRALLMEENPETKEKCVFFIDHGETTWVSEKKVHECPVDLVDALPAQAIRCCLAPGQEESVLHFDSEEVNLNNGGQICTIKVLAKKEQQNPVYEVEVHQRTPILPTNDLEDKGRAMEIWKNAPSCGNEYALEPSNALTSQLDEISLTDAMNFLSSFLGQKDCVNDIDESFDRITEINTEDACVPASPERCNSVVEELSNETGSHMTDKCHVEEAVVTTPGSDQSLESIAYNEDLCKAVEVAEELLQNETNSENSKENKNGSTIESACDVTENDRTEEEESATSELLNSENYKGKIDEIELEDSSDEELQEYKELTGALLKNENASHEVSNTNYHKKFLEEKQTEITMEKDKEALNVLKATSEMGQDLKEGANIGKTETESKSEEVAKVKRTRREAPLDWSGPALQAVESVTPKLKPMASWYQNECRVVLKLNLTGVLLYQCRFSSTHLLFRTVLADRFYELNEHLHGRLNPDLCSVEIHPTQVLVIIVKQHQGMWRRFLHGKDKVAWLNVDWSMADVGSSSGDEEEKLGEAAFVGEANLSLKGGYPAGISDENGSSSESRDSDDSDFYHRIS